MNYASVGFNNSNSVCVAHACDSLRDHNNCGILHSLAQSLLQLRLCCKVEGGGRIIENEYLGASYDSAGD